MKEAACRVHHVNDPHANETKDDEPKPCESLPDLPSRTVTKRNVISRERRKVIPHLRWNARIPGRKGHDTPAAWLAGQLARDTQTRSTRVLREFSI